VTLRAEKMSTSEFLTEFYNRCTRLLPTPLLQRSYEMLSTFSLRSLALLASAVAVSVSAQPAANANCPDYSSFSQSPQGNPSTGPLKLPFMRPAPECRTFASPAVEVSVQLSSERVITHSFLQKVIVDMKARIKDPDLARLFENTFPNTLGTCHFNFSGITPNQGVDTTVKYFNQAST